MTRAPADPLAEQLARWRADRMVFRREAITLEDGRPFGEVVEPWQAEDFAALDSGRSRHAYLERPRGHAKTFDLGTEAVAELVLGAPGQRLYCAAADEDQARLLFDDVADKFRRSPLLRGSVRILQREIVVRATGSRLRVLSSDAPTAYGLRPDWIAVDELSEWRRRELWDSLWTATGKRPRCRMLVITSAGWDFTGIAWDVRQSAEREVDWLFSARGQCASWIRPEMARVTVDGEVRVAVHFLRGLSPYNTGEVAGFREAFAHELVARGHAEYVDPADAGAPSRPAPAWTPREAELLGEGECASRVRTLGGGERHLIDVTWGDVRFDRATRTVRRYLPGRLGSVETPYEGA